MKKLLICSLLLTTSTLAMAEAPGGPDCGWGNMLFKGQNGLGPHILASVTNGTSGNASFGMTTGTNGCSTDGNLTYGGSPLLSMNGVLEEFIEDAANGEGEALNAVAVSMGIQVEDRRVFAEVVHANFDTIFTSADMTAEEVYTSLLSVMKTDGRLSKYVS